MSFPEKSANYGVEHGTYLKVTGAACVLGAVVLYGHNVQSGMSGAEVANVEQSSDIEELREDAAEQQRVSDRLLRYAGGMLDVTDSELAGTDLEQVTALPGYGQTVPQEMARQLSAAAVTLYEEIPSPVPGQDILSQSCSGTYVELGGESYVLSAKHCFMESPGGTSSQPNQISIDNIVAVPAGMDEYMVERTPISSVVVAPGSDYALLSLNVREDKLDDLLEQYPYEEMQADEPIPGEAVAMYSTPGAAYGNIAEGEGVYIGEVDGSFTEWGYTYDIVGLTNTTEPADDACNYGASGSIAVTASGKAFGPLTFRNLLAYPGDDVRIANDNPERAVLDRLRLEQLLDVDLSKFTTLCGYTKPEFPGLLDYLQTGDPALLPQKGGGK